MYREGQQGWTDRARRVVHTRPAAVPAEQALPPGPTPRHPALPGPVAVLPAFLRTLLAQWVVGCPGSTPPVYPPGLHLGPTCTPLAHPVLHARGRGDSQFEVDVGEPRGVEYRGILRLIEAVRHY